MCWYNQNMLYNVNTCPCDLKKYLVHILNQHNHVDHIVQQQTAPKFVLQIPILEIGKWLTIEMNLNAIW